MLHEQDRIATTDHVTQAEIDELARRRVWARVQIGMAADRRRRRRRAAVAVIAGACATIVILLLIV
jgi:hypothetical protein